jgi:hypothetical protein
MRDARPLGYPGPRATVVLLVLLAQAAPALAKAPAPSDGADCECRAAFDDLVEKVEADYVGYHLGVRGRRDAEYGRHVRALRSRATRLAPDDCVRVLQDFVRFFRDGHLFVGQWPQTDEAERAHLASAGEAFVLSAMRNEKVVLFGENTGGTIDYQSTQIVGIRSCRRLGFGLGVPTVAASDGLPRGGANAAGIPPDVRIPRGVRDPVRFVVEYFARSAHREIRRGSERGDGSRDPNAGAAP